ncbi:unnamed protein product [Prunus brigantina]
MVAHKEPNKHPQGDAGCARNFLGRYPGSYPFPKGDRIVIPLPIRSVLMETQEDDQKRLKGGIHAS